MLEHMLLWEGFKVDWVAVVVCLLPLSFFYQYFCLFLSILHSGWVFSLFYMPPIFYFFNTFLLPHFSRCVVLLVCAL